MEAKSSHSQADREAAWNELLVACAEARRQVVPPKLLVLLDPPAHSHDAVQQALIARCETPGLGPVLRLTDADPLANLAEAVAAMQ
jgi:hypothetical protein